MRCIKLGFLAIVLTLLNLLLYLAVIGGLIWFVVWLLRLLGVLHH